MTSNPGNSDTGADAEADAETRSPGAAASFGQRVTLILIGLLVLYPLTAPVVCGISLRIIDETSPGTYEPPQWMFHIYAPWRSVLRASPPSFQHLYSEYNGWWLMRLLPFYHPMNPKHRQWSSPAPYPPPP